MNHLKIRLKARIHHLRLPRDISRVWVRLHTHLQLPCSVVAGIIPLLLWLLFVVLWQNLPMLPGLDMRPITLLVLLIAPFTAGFVHCRQLVNAEAMAGAIPAFWLWLLEMCLYYSLFDLPKLQSAAQSIAITLLLGVAGGLSAKRNSKSE